MKDVGVVYLEGIVFISMCILMVVERSYRDRKWEY